MKLQKRTKVALLSIVLLSLFVGSFYAEATTQVVSVSFPETAEIGKIFEVDVAFAYQNSEACLHGDIVLYYDVGTDPVLDYTQKITVVASTLRDNSRPLNAIIEVDLSTIVCAVNDTFLFRIKYTKGVLSDGVIYSIGTTNTEMYELTIIKASRVSFSAMSLIIPLLALSAIVLIVKKKRMKKLN